MYVEAALYNELAAYAGLTALVSTRIYPKDSAPEAPTLPFVQYQKVSGPRLHAFEGAVGMATPRFQVDALATTYKGAKDIANQVRLCLDGKRGTMGGVGGIDVAVTLDNEIDMGFEPTTKTYQVSLDFLIIHDE